MSKWRSMQGRVAEHGPRNAFDYAVGRGLKLLVGRQLRRTSRPSLSELYSCGSSAYSADQALAALSETKSLKPALISEIDREYLAVHEGLMTRYEQASLRCPEEWRVGAESARFLYAYVRLARPRSVVETGVANGHSTHCILAALAPNAHGHLWSVDMKESVGVLVPSSLHSMWTLRVAESRSGRALADSLSEAAPVDLFLHDSEHSWLQQTSEYRQAYAVLSSDGVIVSDDVEKSYGWIDWCAEIGGRGVVLFDGGKAVGLISRHRAACSAEQSEQGVTIAAKVAGNRSGAGAGARSARS